ncbi:unnamed protein product [Prorocentrum cordatum]|uniref:Uncharacterized protein n=1 Tax=Prorocentrum cordatum TaxID=2364126 RepID=A0ABN9SA30_9DINO|nr:unnamed protein product [Polarella glacialis]
MPPKEPDAVRVQQLLDAGEFTAPEREKAETKLGRRADNFGGTPREQVLKIMMACTRLGHKRLGDSQLSNLIPKVKFSIVATVKKTYWVCPTELLPKDLPPGVVRPPSMFVLPAGFDIQNFSIVDKKVDRPLQNSTPTPGRYANSVVAWRLSCPPRGAMPIDTGELELAMKETMDFSSAGPSASGALALGDRAPQQEVGGAPSAQQPPPTVEPKGTDEPAEKPATRELQKEDSSERPPPNLEKTLNGMAHTLKEAAKDPMCKDTVHHVLQRFVNFALSSGWNQGEEPKVAINFMRYLVKRLRNTESLDYLSHMVKPMEQLMGKLPALVPETGKVVIHLSKLSFLTETPLNYGTLDLDEQNEFDSAPLYKQWMRRRFDKKLEKVRGDAGKDPKERRGELAGMQSQFDKIDGEGKMTEEVKAQYNFGMSVLSPSMSLGGQVEYLQGLGETGWSMLETWWPKSPATKFAKLVPGAETSVEDVVAAASSVPPSDLAQAASHLNPVVVRLCEMWHPLTEAVADKPARDRLFRETVSYKLKGADSCENTGAEVPQDGVIEKAGGVLWPLWRSRDVTAAPPLTKKCLELERARLETKKKEKEEKEEKDKAGKAQADKGKADSPAGEGKKRAAEEGQAGPDPKKAKTEGQTDPLDWLKPGVEVICSCKLTKDKSKYEGKKGQVVSLVKANTACSVKLLEGSEANKRHVFVLSQLSPVPGAASSGNAAADSGGAAPPEKDDLFSDPELEKER